MRPYVYVAGPMSLGDISENVHQALTAAERIVRSGGWPYVPHMTLLWHLITPHEKVFWLTLDNAWLLRCNALLRLPGESTGADGEVALANVQRIPIFNDVSACCDWCARNANN